MKVRFFLNTSADRFARWLRHYTLSAPYRDFPWEKGRIVMQGAKPPDHITGPTRIEMGAIYLVPSGKDIETGSWPLPAISFLVVPLSPKRVEVTAQRHHAAVRDYFEELVTEIGKCWPEAKEWLEPRPEEPGEETVERQKVAKRLVRPHIKARRIKVMNLSKRGFTVHDIAKRVYCSERTVKRDREALREEGLL